MQTRSVQRAPHSGPPRKGDGIGAVGCPSRSDSGFVLVLVLWMLALLMAIALALNVSVRLGVQAKANLVHQAEAEAIADGLTFALAAAVVAQVSGLAETQLPATPGRMMCDHEGSLVELDVTDVAGLVDINAAAVPTLARVIASTGVALARAEQIAAAIADFRDADDEVTPGGAEAAEYRAAGRPYGPKNAPFERIEELDQVLGMSPDLLSRLRDLVTVHARSASVDAALAPDDVRRALAYDPAFGSGQDRDRERPARAEATARQPAESLPARSRIQRLRAAVSTPQGGRFVRQAIIQVQPVAKWGFVLRDWDAQPGRSDDAGKPASPRRACLALLSR